MPQTYYSGNAAPTTLVGALSAAAGPGTIITLANGTGYPTGSGGINFVITLDGDSALEEKILCSLRSGNNCTIAQRNYDDTAAVAHSNCSVRHTPDATVLRTASAHSYDTTRDEHAQYARTDGSRTITGNTIHLGADHRFGPWANGVGPGTRIRLGGLGDAANAYVLAENSSPDANLLLMGQGAGGVILRSSDGQNVLNVNNPGGAGNRWVAGVVSIGYGAAGAANTYISLGSESTSQVNLTAQGYAADVNLRLAVKGLGQWYLTDQNSNVKINIRNDGSIYSIGAATYFGGGALGADQSYVGMGHYDPDNAIFVSGQGQRATANLIFQTKGNGAFTLRIGSDLNKQMVFDANGDWYVKNGGVTQFGIGHDGSLSFNNPTTVWSGSASDGGIAPHPTNVRGYIQVYVNTIGYVKIPVFLP